MGLSQSIGIVGGGLAGCEAAWQLCRRGFEVTLYEMRPGKQTPAHQTDGLAELVCSNSFKSIDSANAHGLLKAELTLAGSLIMEAAKESAVPAGAALAVDREQFSRRVHQKLSELPTFRLLREEISDLEQIQQRHTVVLLCSGPLTSEGLANSLQAMLGENELFFYDSIAPVVFTESIDFEVAYRASRYGKGGADYINCPLNFQEYETLIEDLRAAEKIPFREFEQERHFEGCLPIEVMAGRGLDTLAFGPMKPVGLEDPKTGKIPYAVLQLRQENQSGTLFNLVGFQTRMTWSEQKRVFRKIPGLSRAEFARFGSMHRNTYINAPNHLTATLSLKKNPNLYLAGQITGVEGYTESTAMGLWAALQISERLGGRSPLEAQPATMIGGLVHYLQTASPASFQPMNSNFGLLTPLSKKGRLKKSEKRAQQAAIALEIWQAQLEELKAGEKGVLEKIKRSDLDG